jgi:predicted Rossmann-fold nucleotide-binding protein
LVYGGGSFGIMGIVSGAVLEDGGQVTGIVPYAMVAAGGEGSGSTKIIPANSAHVVLNEVGREQVS